MKPDLVQRTANKNYHFNHEKGSRGTWALGWAGGGAAEAAAGPLAAASPSPHLMQNLAVALWAVPQPPHVIVDAAAAKHRRERNPLGMSYGRERRGWWMEATDDGLIVAQMSCG